MGPNRPKKARNFILASLKSAFALAKNEKVRVADNEADRRWNICQGCDDLSDKGQCVHCGCAMRRKVHWNLETCPIGKWDLEHLVSVVIAALPDETHLSETVSSLESGAFGPIEVIVMNDSYSEPRGRRSLINEGVLKANGKYIYIVDSHCLLTKGWDRLLKDELDDEQDMVFSPIQALDIAGDQLSWGNGRYGCVYLDKHLVEKWGPRLDEATTAESMAMTGCGFMLHKKRFWELGGYDETLAGYGGDGPEWSLKVWLSGGMVRCCGAVTCGHLFAASSQSARHRVSKDEIARTYQRIRILTTEGKWPEQKHGIEWLLGRFWPVAGWNEQTFTRTKPQVQEWVSVAYA